MSDKIAASTHGGQKANLYQLLRLIYSAKRVIKNRVIFLIFNHKAVSEITSNVERNSVESFAIAISI